MKQWISIAALIMVAHVTLAGGDSSSIKGYWMNESGEFIVNIYQEDSTFKGKIVWLADSLDKFGQPLRDVMNKEPEMRSRLVRGMNVLEGFELDDGIWKHGRVYDYKSGNDYNARMKLDDEGNLRLTGYYGILFFLGKTKVWKRVSSKGKYGLK